MTPDYIVTGAAEPQRFTGWSRALAWARSVNAALDLRMVIQYGPTNEIVFVIQADGTERSYPSC